MQISLGIQEIIQDKFPGFYISFKIERESYGYESLLRFHLRYSPKYEADRFHDLYNRQAVFRLNLYDYYDFRLSVRRSNDEQFNITVLIIRDILKNAILHLEQDVSNLTRGEQYLSEFNLPERELVERRYRALYDVCDPLANTYRYSQNPFYRENERYQGIHVLSPTVRSLLEQVRRLVENETQNRNDIQRQIAEDCYRHEFLGLEQVIRSGNIDATNWARERLGAFDSWGLPKENPEATKKAEELLLSVLTKEQKEQYEKDKTFICYGCETGTKYRILPKLQINIEVLDDNDKHRLCITPVETVPAADQQLAIKLMLESSESYLLKTAIRHRA